MQAVFKDETGLDKVSLLRKSSVTVQQKTPLYYLYWKEIPFVLNTSNHKSNVLNYKLKKCFLKGVL